MTKSRGILAPRRRWTDDEIETVRINYADHETYVIAYLVDRSVLSVYQLAQKLGLRKSAAYLETDRSGRVQRGKQDSRMRAHQFKPGQTPPNKGTRRPGWSVGRMRETQFKKGRPATEARNYRPIGTVKVDSKRKVLMRKVTDDPSIFPVSRWRPVHVLVWEAVHGPVPPGHIVVFRPGMKTFEESEITVDRLELVSLAENMRRNTIHNLPPDLKEVIQLTGALKRKIKTRSKENVRTG